MSINKEVVFSAKDNGFSSAVDRMRQQTEKLGSGMIKDALKFSESGKEQLRYINDQIQAMERKNKLYADEQNLVAKTNYQQALQGSTSGKQKSAAKSAYQDTISRNSLEADQDSMQTKLLRELIEAVKLTSKEEIKEDRKAVQDSVKSFDKLSPGQKERMSPEEALKRGLQRMEIGDVKESEADENAKFDKGLKRLNTAAQLGASKNELYAAVAVAAMIPGIGGGVSALANKAISEGDKLQKSQKSLRASTGYGGGFGDMSGVGYTQAESSAFAERLAKTRGYGVSGDGGLRGGTRGLMAQMRNYGISESNVMNMAQIQGFDKNRRDTFGDIEHFVSIMQKDEKMKGAFGKGDFSSVNKYLEIQNELIRDQTTRLENGNSDDTARSMVAMMQVGGSFASKGTMGARMKSINNALINPSNEWQQAEAYSVLRKLDPNASIYELGELQEQGINAKTDRGTYLGEKMKQMKSSSGSKETLMQKVRSEFKLSYAQGRQLTENFTPEEFDRIMQEQTEGKLGKTVEQEVGVASRNTGDIDKMTAATSDMFAGTGVKVIEAFSGGLESLTTLMGGEGGVSGAIANWTKDLIDSNENVKKFTETVAEATVVMDKNTQKTQKVLGKSWTPMSHSGIK